MREHLETLEQTHEAGDKGGRDMGVAEEKRAYFEVTTFSTLFLVHGQRFVKKLDRFPPCEDLARVLQKRRRLVKHGGAVTSSRDNHPSRNRLVP